MKAIVRYGQAFGGYTMRDVPEPTCGPEDIILEIKAAAICGADMKHWRVDNGSDEFNSIRGDYWKFFSIFHRCDRLYVIRQKYQTRRMMNKNPLSSAITGNMNSPRLLCSRITLTLLFLLPLLSASAEYRGVHSRPYRFDRQRRP